MRDRSAATERVSKADHVYRALRQSIIEGALSPGEPIDKEGLGARLKASRSPVTIAINRLAYEGLVRVAPQHGSFVAPISLDEITQLMMLRRALEADGVAEAARRAGPDLWARLDRNLADQKTTIAAADHGRFFELDLEFHHAIIAESGWTKFNQVLAEAHAHLDRARRVIMPIPGHLDATWAEHYAIVDAVKRRAPDDASRHMRQHIDRVAGQFRSFAAQRPDLFGGGAMQPGAGVGDRLSA